MRFLLNFGDYVPGQTTGRNKMRASLGHRFEERATGVVDECHRREINNVVTFAARRVGPHPNHRAPGDGRTSRLGSPVRCPGWGLALVPRQSCSAPAASSAALRLRNLFVFAAIAFSASASSPAARPLPLLILCRLGAVS